MKSIILLIIFSGALHSSAQVSVLNGRWKLDKIELNEETLIPDKNEYFLTFSEEYISFNLEVNHCQTNDFTIDNKTITFGPTACTEICCDGRYDTISNYINYNGNYTVMNEVLIISNQKSKLYLKRTKVK